MRTGLIRELRELLRSHPDGLSTKELCQLTKRDDNNLRNALTRMPDTYIDRWDGPMRGQYTAVWCIVVPPDNCPHPTRSVVAVRSSRRKDFAADAPCNREIND